MPSFEQGPKIGGEDAIDMESGEKIEMGGEVAKTPEKSWDKRMEELKDRQMQLSILQREIERDMQKGLISNKILEAMDAKREELNKLAEELNAEKARNADSGYMKRIEQI